MIAKLIRLFIPQSLIRKMKIKYRVPDMQWSLENLYANGFRPKNIIDIGAYQGEWTKETMHIFPASNYLMVEANPEKENRLRQMKSDRVDYEICLLGNDIKEKAKFYVNETVSSALPESEKSNQDFVEIPMYRLDDLLKNKNMNEVDFLKLDVQGFELEVLKGAAETLKQAEVVLMEVSLIEINKGAPLLYEVIAFMKLHHFSAYDICSLIRRPFDLALWQTDIIFVRENSVLRTSKRYE